jgi:hypothetical protein
MPGFIPFLDGTLSLLELYARSLKNRNIIITLVLHLVSCFSIKELICFFLLATTPEVHLTPSGVAAVIFKSGCKDTGFTFSLQIFLPFFSIKNHLFFQTVDKQYITNTFLFDPACIPAQFLQKSTLTRTFNWRPVR